MLAVAIFGVLSGACAIQKAQAKQEGSSLSRKISVSADFAKPNGFVKALNGVNFGPSIYCESAGYVNRKQFYNLNVHSVRLHDISLVEKGLKIVDTDLVFPLFHADSNDERNYIFKPTDDYIKLATAHGAKIVYRLGVSIDHSIAKYRTEMPDAKKWADICCHIIAHYNEGWANGFKMGIEYWEIWNEPNCQNPDGSKTMWAGTLEEYNKFYCEVAKIIKARFPKIKIGGPAHTHVEDCLIEPFLKEVAKENAPLDFYSWHSYARTVDSNIAQVVTVKKYLEKYGFKNTELHLNEWHYFPLDWKELRAAGSDKDKLYSKISNLESGVFSIATMIAWQDYPISVANYYTFANGNWGMLDNSNVPYGSYYPFMAFGKIVEYKNRVEASSSLKNAYVLASRNDANEPAVLIALFKTGASTLEIDLKNAGCDLSKLSVLICDGEKKLEKADGVKIEGNKISVPVKSDSACILIK